MVKYRSTGSVIKNIVTHDQVIRLPRYGTSVYEPRGATFQKSARKNLLMLHAATILVTLKVPPGNKLEALRGDRRGQHSVGINDQWRICFVWKLDGPHDVEIVGYH